MRELTNYEIEELSDWLEFIWDKLVNRKITAELSDELLESLLNIDRDADNWTLPSAQNTEDQLVFAITNTLE